MDIALCCMRIIRSDLVARARWRTSTGSRCENIWYYLMFSCRLWGSMTDTSKSTSIGISGNWCSFPFLPRRVCDTCSASAIAVILFWRFLVALWWLWSLTCWFLWACADWSGAFSFWAISLMFNREERRGCMPPVIARKVLTGIREQGWFYVRTFGTERHGRWDKCDSVWHPFLLSAPLWPSWDYRRYHGNHVTQGLTRITIVTSRFLNK